MGASRMCLFTISDEIKPKRWRRQSLNILPSIVMGVNLRAPSRPLTERCQKYNPPDHSKGKFPCPLESNVLFRLCFRPYGVFLRAFPSSGAWSGDVTPRPVPRKALATIAGSSPKTSYPHINNPASICRRVATHRFEASVISLDAVRIIVAWARSFAVRQRREANVCR